MQNLLSILLEKSHSEQNRHPDRFNVSKKNVDDITERNKKSKLVKKIQKRDAGVNTQRYEETLNRLKVVENVIEV